MSRWKFFDEMELSALKEVGNIITASYLSALASMTNLTILPSVPYICVDMAAAILSVPAIEFGLVGDRALLIETEICADVAIRGYFILMPEQGILLQNIISTWVVTVRSLYGEYH